MIFCLLYDIALGQEYKPSVFCKPKAALPLVSMDDEFSLREALDLDVESKTTLLTQDDLTDIGLTPTTLVPNSGFRMEFITFSPLPC
jgi:hypothetical protein